MAASPNQGTGQLSQQQVVQVPGSVAGQQVVLTSSGQPGQQVMVAGSGAPGHPGMGLIRFYIENIFINLLKYKLAFFLVLKIK